MKTTFIFFFCFFLLTFSACSAQKASHKPSQNNDLPPVGQCTDPSQTIRVKPGDKFVVVLDSNATTGYSWQAPERTSHVSLNSHRYEAPLTSLAGAGGKEYFEFTARSVGKENLVFNYLRSWEKDTPPVKTAIFTVEIIPKSDKK